jgi:hypothetical protein
MRGLYTCIQVVFDINEYSYTNTGRVQHHRGAVMVMIVW